MPVNIVCPSCNAKLKAPDNLIGKAVKCPTCSKPVLVKAPGAAAPPAPAPAPVKKPVKPPAPVLDEEPIEEIEDVDEEPVRAPVKKAGKKPAADLDEEPIEDVDSIEDELDSPRPKKKKKGAAKGEIAGGPSTDKERTTAMWIHLLPIVLSWCCGVGTWISLFLWISKKKESAFIDHHGKTWLNWVINIFAVGIVFGIFATILQVVGGLTGSDTVAMLASGLVALLGFALSVAILVMQVMVALKAKKGEWAEYKVLFKVLK